MKAFQTLLILLAIGLPWSLLLVRADKAQPREADLPDGVVARVKNRTISAEDVLERINEVETFMPPKDQHLKQAVSYLVNLNMMRCEAELLGIEVTDEDRKKVTEEQVEAIKKQVKEKTGGAVTWERWLKENGYSTDEFYRYVYNRAEPIILRRRVIHYFERTNTFVRYVQIKLSSKDRASGVLTSLQNAREKNPEEFDKEFREIALLNSADRKTRKTAYRYQGLPEKLETLLFETLDKGAMSEVIEVAADDYRIVMLQTRTAGTKATFAELKADIDRSEDVDEERYQRWAAVMLNTRKYQPALRIPGQKAEVQSSSESEDDQ